MNTESESGLDAISICIPSWNGLHLLRENLPSVLAAASHYELRTGSQTEIIIVDDGSQDHTAESLPAEFPETKIIARNQNGGFASACNSGFKACRFPLIALLNNDVRVLEDYLYYHALHFKNPRVFAVTSRVYEWDQPIFSTGGRFGRFRRGFWSVFFNYDVTVPQAQKWIEQRKLLSAYAIGGFTTYRRSHLNQLGGFNDLLSPFHWEDVDISYRGWKRGWEVHYEPRSIARHRTSATINSHYSVRHVKRVAFRNRLLFHWINLHSRSFLIRHLASLFGLVVVKALVLDLDFYRALQQALMRWPKAARLRRLEKKESRRSDRDVARRLRDFYAQAPIQIYYNRREVQQKHPGCSELRFGRS